MSDIGQKINAYLTRLKNDEKCFDEFFNYTFGYIEVIAFKYLVDKSKTDDVVSITFKSVYFNLKMFDPNKNGFAWMYEIAKNEAYKINQRDSAKYVPLEHAENIPSLNDYPDSVLEKYDLCIAISKLSEDEQDLLDLVIFQDLGIKKVARMKRMSYWTVYRAINKIYKKLKEYLK